MVKYSLTLWRRLILFGSIPTKPQTRYGQNYMNTQVVLPNFLFKEN